MPSLSALLKLEPGEGFEPPMSLRFLLTRQVQSAGLCDPGINWWLWKELNLHGVQHQYGITIRPRLTNIELTTNVCFCLVHVEGFEPTQPEVTGLQSASALQLGRTCIIWQR